MDHLNTEKDQPNEEQLEWRYDQVLQLAANGYSEREIATKLQLSKTTIHRDLTTLKQRAKRDIHKYITHNVPWEYKKTLAGLEGIIKNMSDIIVNSHDNREIMNATGIKMQAYNIKMEMVAGADLIKEGIELVERYRGSMTQKGKVVRDGTEQPA